MIKKLKELGGKINICCLEIASGVQKNFKVVKFLINELGIKPNETCIRNYMKEKTNFDSQELDDILLKNYTNKKIELPKERHSLKLDINSTVTIEPKNLLIDKES